MPTLIMMVGVSYSGKSYIAERLSEAGNIEIISSDRLRLELYGDENDQEHNHELFIELHRRIREYLMSGKSVVYDATNLSAKRRKAFLNEIKNIQCYKECMVVVAPIKTLKHRHKTRKRVVPWEVIEGQIKKFNCPDTSEGWDRVMLMDSKHHCYLSCISSYLTLYLELLKSIFISHNNPHHKKTIGCHMVSAAINYYKNYHPLYNKFLISKAVLFHDIGKPFCKSFKNSRGCKTSTAHYYGHENVSSYLWLAHSLVFNDAERLAVGTLINWHMKPYLLSEEKFQKFSSEISDQIGGSAKLTMLKHIHQCDKKAH
jgi:predicted kinase